MRNVAIVGAGMVPFGKFPKKHLADIAWPAVKQAVEDAGIKIAKSPADIGKTLLNKLSN